MAQRFIDGSAAVALPDDHDQREVDDVRLAVATLGDQIAAATSSLKEWQGRVTAAEVGLLKALQREAAKHYSECADHMQAAFSIMEAGHRALDERKAGGQRTGAWSRLSIPVPDADQRRRVDDFGMGWTTSLARESGECARAAEALQAIVAA